MGSSRSVRPAFDVSTHPRLQASIMIESRGVRSGVGRDREGLPNSGSARCRTLRDPRHEAENWVTGTTRIDLLETSANWSIDWSLETGPRGPRSFQFVLDPGLELIDVTGPGVEESQAETLNEGGARSSTRVTVRMATPGDSNSPTTISVRAMTRVPSAGTWSIPAARPEGAVWTGGTTTVRLDASRVLEQVVERHGRRVLVPPGKGPGTAVDPARLIFEARAAESVADLVFRPFGGDVSAEVRGRLLLSNQAPRLECQVAWRTHRGRLFALDIDLPATWIPERVRIAGQGDSSVWHPELQPGGGTRVHIAPPAGEPVRGPLLMTLEATSNVAGGRGPLALPRVRPSSPDVRLGDEVWTAWCEQEFSLKPTSARGLAWMDTPSLSAPRTVSGNPLANSWPEPPGLRVVLGWRWVSDRAEARVERQKIETEPDARIDLHASIDPHRLSARCRITIEPGSEPIRKIPVRALSLPETSVEKTGVWQFTDVETGLEIHPHHLDPEAAAPLRFAPDANRPGQEIAETWELILPQSARKRIVLDARLDLPWKGRGTLPLLALPERFHPRGTVLIDLDRKLKSSIETIDWHSIDLAEAQRQLREAESETEPRQHPAGPG